MDLARPIARNLDDPARIMGLSPLELAGCALTYSILSPALRGVPFSALISLVLMIGMGCALLILNRTHPPYHGLYLALQLFRPRVTSVMSFGMQG